jgi:acetyltransferase-like isoleucine patch superfamily enzyme
MALLPGAPGRFLRRAFYRWTLDGCAEDVTIEFGAIFSRRSVILSKGVYVGAYALVGSARIGEGTLIGSRVSVLSGGQQHTLLPSGRWSHTDASRLTQIEIGRDNWIGEGAIVLANTGNGCMVAAGSVVSSAVPGHVMVAGNPGRFVRHLRPSVENSAASHDRDRSSD